MSARTTLTAAIAARLAADGATVYIGRKRSNELEAPCIILVPGDEVPKSNEPLGNVEISYSIAAYRKRSEETDEEYIVIDSAIGDIRAAVEACGLPAYWVAYDGARPIYSEEGGDLIGAELRYSISTPYTQYFGEV
jgi:hypothetical protein